MIKFKQPCCIVIHYASYVNNGRGSVKIKWALGPTALKSKFGKGPQNVRTFGPLKMLVHLKYLMHIKDIGKKKPGPENIDDIQFFNTRGPNGP